MYGFKMAQNRDDKALRQKLTLQLAGKASDTSKAKARALAYEEQGLIDLNQEKPSLVYSGKDTILSACGKMRSMSDKIANGMKLDSGDRYHGGEFVPLDITQATTPQHLVNAPKFAKPRKASPFKKEKVKPVIVRIVSHA